MSLLTRFTEVAARIFPRYLSTVQESYVQDLRGDVESLKWENEDLQESVTRLQLELENEGYRRLTQGSEHEFSRVHLDELTKLTVLMVLKNPLMSRTVNVQADYVFGRGVRFIASHPLVQSVVDEHVKYRKNQACLYSHDAMARQERELQVNGNLFFMLATNPRTGRVTIIDIPMSEVVDIIRNPDDYHDEWFIKRAYSDGNSVQVTVFYPALGVTKQTGAVLPANESGQGNIAWNSPVHHVAFNKYGRMKFAVPEIYPSIDWALAYKRFLEDWSSIMRSFARMAMKIKGLAGKKQAAAAKSKIQTSIGLTNPLETNPSPVGGSIGLFGKGTDVEPVKTAGATTNAKEGQPILNMVASGAGLPNTFYGDASQARGDSLDRPTELKMLARQRLWSMIFEVNMEYVVLQSAKCLMGILREAGASTVMDIDPFNDQRVFNVVMPVNSDKYFGEVDAPISTKVIAKFPELLERNVTDRVRALVNAVTQFGKPLSDIIPDKRFVCRLLLEALNVEGIDDLIPQFVTMWEANMKVGDDNKPVDAIIIPPLPPANGGGAEDPSQGGDTGANG